MAGDTDGDKVAINLNQKRNEKTQVGFDGKNKDDELARKIELIKEESNSVEEADQKTTELLMMQAGMKKDEIKQASEMQEDIEESDKQEVLVIQCPNCKAQIALAKDEVEDEITCNNCEDEFALDDKVKE